MIFVKDFRVTFSHLIDPYIAKTIGEHEGAVETVTGVTICYIEKNDVLINTGVSCCTERDIFNKETGRIIALRRASNGLSYEDRKDIHEAYENRHPDLSDKVLIDDEWVSKGLVRNLLSMHRGAIVIDTEPEAEYGKYALKPGDTIH